MEKLTKRQSEVLAMIKKYMLDNGAPPTRADIAHIMGFRSPNAAEDHLQALAKKKAIELIPGFSRGIRLSQHMNRVYTPIFPQSILYTGIPDIKPWISPNLSMRPAN